MKNLMLISLTLIFINNVTFAQHRTVEKSFAVKSDQKVFLNLKFGEMITVKAWNKNEVSFEADIEINSGRLNDALMLNFDEQDGQLRITSDYDEELLKTGQREDCPDSHSTYSWNNGGEGYVACSNIIYTLFVPANVDLSIDTISGDIELVDLRGPVRAKSISGFVDVSWPTGKPADVDLKTISGEVFTDMESLEFTNKKKDVPLVGYKINGKIGSGGPRVSLESISGNIYLRKGKG